MILWLKSFAINAGTNEVILIVDTLKTPVSKIAIPNKIIFTFIFSNWILESVAWPIIKFELSLPNLLLKEESNELKDEIIKASAIPEDIININAPNNCLLLLKDICLYNLFRALNWLPVNVSKDYLKS